MRALGFGKAIRFGRVQNEVENSRADLRDTPLRSVEYGVTERLHFFPKDNDAETARLAVPALSQADANSRYAARDRGRAGHRRFSGLHAALRDEDAHRVIAGLVVSL